MNWYERHIKAGQLFKSTNIYYRDYNFNFDPVPLNTIVMVIDLENIAGNVFYLMEEKLCSKCKVVKPTNQFRRLYEGYRSECKECYKEYINRNKETIKAKKAEYYKRKKEEKMKAEKSSNIKLFEYIYESVLESGGDGDVAVVFTAQNHRVVADEFEKFLKTKPFGCWQRTNQEDGDVVFYDQQESFVFSNHDHFCYWRELRGPNPVTDKTPCTQKVITP